MSASIVEVVKAKQRDHPSHSGKGIQPRASVHSQRVCLPLGAYATADLTWAHSQEPVGRCWGGCVIECRAIHSGSTFGTTRGHFKVLMAGHNGSALVQSPGATPCIRRLQLSSGCLVICALRPGTTGVGNSPDPWLFFKESVYNAEA